MKNGIKTNLKDFNTSIKELKKLEKEGKRICQTHNGDFLMIEEETKEGDNFFRYRVWLSHPNNILEGQQTILIEHSGPTNGYTWKFTNKRPDRKTKYN